MSVRPKSRVHDREANMTQMQLAQRDRFRRQQREQNVASALDRAATGWVELLADSYLIPHVQQAMKRSGTWYETEYNTEEQPYLFRFIRMDAYVQLLLDAARIRMVRVPLPPLTGSKQVDDIIRRKWLDKIKSIKHAAHLDSQRFVWSNDYYTSHVFYISAQNLAKVA